MILLWCFEGIRDWGLKISDFRVWGLDVGAQGLFEGRFQALEVELRFWV